MAVRVDWDNDEKNIVRFLYDDVWTWEDFFNAVRQTKNMAEIAPSYIGVIMDAETSHLKFPPNMVTHLKNALRNRHPKTKIVVVTIQNAFLRTMVSTIAKVAGKDGHALLIADSVDEARRLIREHLAQLEMAASH
jgi:ketopantoate reductase